MPRGGAPLPKPSKYDEYRLWQKIDRSGGKDACWPFTGALSNSGYGRFKIGGKLVSPHRLVCAIVNDGIPASDAYHGYVVMHSCDNPRCCNPAHLTLGVQSENVRDMDGKGRRSPKVYLRHSEETIRLIRASRASSRELSKAIGVADGYIRQVRRGEARREPRPC